MTPVVTASRAAAPTFLARLARLALVALVALVAAGATGCRDVRIEARCVTRPAGSYCTFHNTGARRGEACFVVTVRRVGSDETYARARACSGPLAPGEHSPPRPLAFDNAAPFARCVFDPATGEARDCETRALAESARAVQ